MGLIRLAVCVSGVYGAFLWWAIAQERLSAPFPGIAPHSSDKFPSPLFFNWCQSLASATCAAIYLLVVGVSDGSLKRDGVLSTLGLKRLFASLPGKKNDGATTPPTTNGDGNGNGNGSGSTPQVAALRAYINGTGSATVSATASENGSLDDKTEKDEESRRPSPSPEANSKATVAAPQPPRPWYQSLPVLLLQVSIFQTTAGPLGFLALRHISYPTMVLGKSCKLIPVLLLNVLLYRRRFGAHKYVVVALVSAGISLFMLFGKKSASKGGDSVWGLSLLLFNLFVDGLTNSTQDQIFALYKGYSGQQMMFIMACMSLSVLTPAMLLPLPSSPLSLLSVFNSPDLARLHTYFSPPILLTSVRFITSHPTSLPPLGAYAALGGLGQIFIFETIAHFGSLTLVMVTVTRKLFTMLLSVFVFGHVLTPGQWAGVAVVFAGIGVEALFKRREVSKRARRDVKK